MNILEYCDDLAERCLKSCGIAFQMGSRVLAKDLGKAKNYDHDSPSGKYEEKDEYFNRANLAGYPFLTKNLTCLSKNYYWKMFNQITHFEKSQGVPLNKGMVCANWGVSDLAEGDVDGGIAHLLWAGYEDRGWSKTSYAHNIFKSQLYTQFAEGSQRGGKSQFGGQAPHIMLEDAITEFNKLFGTSWTKDDVFKSLSDNDEHRAILEGALWTLARNLPIYKEENPKIFDQDRHNIYTKLRLFNGLVDLCRFVELKMRHYEKPPQGVRTLGNLINHVFGKESWFSSDVRPNYAEPQTAQDFNNVIKGILQLKPPAKYVLLLWITRNYSVHICNVEAPDFFDNLGDIFQSIMGCYFFYQRLRGII